MPKSLPTLSAVLLAVLSLTAFAPAPLPRRTAPIKDAVDHKSLIGTWRATKLGQTGSTEERDPASNGVAQVTITETQWVFNRNQNNTATYDLRIEHLKRPAEIDFMHAGQKDPYGRGVIKREGNTLRIIYTGSTTRPTGFENQSSGFWDLTLVRE